MKVAAAVVSNVLLLLFMVILYPAFKQLDGAVGPVGQSLVVLYDVLGWLAWLYLAGMLGVVAVRLVYRDKTVE